MKSLKLMSILLILLLILINFPYNSDYHLKNDRNSNSLESNVNLTNFNGNIVEKPLGTRSQKVEIHNNDHGGSWLDSFEDDSGIGYEYNLYHKLGDISLKKFSYIPNGDFEEGTVGQIPDNWTYHTWNTGTGGIFQVKVKQNNTQYYSGKHCMYGYVKGDEGTIGGYRQYLNATTKSFVNVSGARYVYIFMRDIKEYHPYSWGWTNFITLQYFDGVNKHQVGTYPNFLYYSGQYAGSANNYDFIALGADGQTWYAYKREIPKTINTSNFNLTIIWYANDWTTTIGQYSEISSVVDNVYLENDPYGVVFSKPINKPKDMIWDTIIINKTQTKNNYINITILNASNNKPIIGSPAYINDGEFDISFIDPLKYPSLKLKANITRNLTSAPILHYWGVSWNATNTWRDTLYGGQKCFIKNFTYGDGEIWLPTLPNEWYKYSGNPILSDGPSSSWDDDGVYCGSIIYNGTGFMMWYHGKSGSNWQIGLATSADGITWKKYSGNPILSKNLSLSWESDNIARPRVIFNGKGYIMWYNGRNSTSLDLEVGLATSSDGITWNKHPNNPVIKTGSSSDWDDHYVTMDDVEYDGVMYKAWYTGLSQITPPTLAPYRIGYATSYDGENWNKYSSNPILQGPMGWYNGLHSMKVFNEQGQYYGWYHRNPGISGSTDIHHATSIDGISWVKSSKNPVLQIGSTGTWDDDSVIAPRIILKDKQFYMYYTGSDGSTVQIGLAKSKFNTNGILTSEQITIPTNSLYGKLIINKTEPTGTYINISILDGDTEQTIMNFKDITKTSVDLASISPLQHPSIKLKATFESNGYSTPILYDWSINWTRNQPPEIIDIISDPAINRTFSRKILINLTDLEEPEKNLTPLIKYKAPSDLTWHTKYLSSPTYESDHWECIFTPDKQAELGLYDFYFKCNDSFQLMDTLTKLHLIEVINNNPIIWNISSNLPGNNVKRTNSIKFYINASDIETPANFLDIEIKYKSQQNIDWQYEHISNLLYLIDHWEVEFTPTSKHSLGEYIFNITCRDNETEVYDYTKIWVQNNAPVTLEVAIIPSEPRTRDDLSIRVLNAFDIETSFNKLKFWYRWYKDNFYMKDFDNSTIIPAAETVKDQTWRCVVFPHDGIDLGTPAETETIILNSPPELIEEFNTFDMFEDQPVIINEKLTTIFTDADNDPLKFSLSGQDNLKVEIIQDNGTIKISSPQNWFGTESITFYANDTFSPAAQETVIITVYPTNDLPRISQIGNQYISDSSKEYQFIVKQDDWLNLTIIVEDIDGDVERGLITYSLNITHQQNLYFRDHDNTLIFHPSNSDVGCHYINITITDNNETPTQYVHQHIKIRVLNLNDMPTVQIIIPLNNQKFKESDKISFKCTASDIDFLIWNSNEELTYRWYTNKTEFGDLGILPELLNISLEPGFYNVTIEVEDAFGAKAFDYVHIKVNKLTKEKTNPTTTTSVFLWIVIIIIIVIIIVSILLFVLTKKKKKEIIEKDIQPQVQVLQPDAAYLPESPSITPGAQLVQPQVMTAEPMAAAPAQDLLVASPIATSTTEPTAQLPAMQPASTVTPHEQAVMVSYEQKSGIDSRLTPQQKLELLEQRLLQGEIDQDIYLNLKAKYEMEAQPYIPPPQLPPPSVTPATTQVPEHIPEPAQVPPPQAISEPLLPSDLPTDAYQQPPTQPPHPPSQPLQPQLTQQQPQQTTQSQILKTQQPTPEEQESLQKPTTPSNQQKTQNNQQETE